MNARERIAGVLTVVGVEDCYGPCGHPIRDDVIDAVLAALPKLLTDPGLVK